MPILLVDDDNIDALIIKRALKELKVTNPLVHKVAGYFVKPVDYKKFVETMRILDMYWTLSELPNTNSPVN